MGIFATRAARAVAVSGTSAELTPAQRLLIPQGLEAVGEALVSGTRSVVEACWVVGRDLAEVGVSLGESLDRLRSTTQLLARRDPAFDEIQALSTSWSEVTLTFLHRLSCADPMTGLASHAHLSERLAERYRECSIGGLRREGALVVLEVPGPSEFVGHAQRMTRYGEMARGVFSGAETIGRVGVRRLVVVAQRDRELVPRVGLLRRMVADRGVRIWIEGLPGTERAALHILDELARD